MSWGPKRNRTQWRDGLSRTSWQDFERLLARHYREEGFEVEHCGTAANAARFDGGVDLVLRKNGETVLVQCKHWNASQVPHNEVHQLLGLVETRGAQRAVLITSGEFTAAAREAGSRSSRIELVDGVALRLMIDPRMIPESQPTTGREPGSAIQAWAPVAEKAIDAFMNVKTGGRWRRQRQQTPEQALKELGLRLLFAAVLALIAFLFIRHQIQNVQESFSRPTVRVQSRTAPAVPPVRPASRVASTPPTSATTGNLPRTPEELAEWKRRNAESMKVLEQSTPSVDD